MGYSHGRRTTINEARNGESRLKTFWGIVRATYSAVSPAATKALLAAVVSARVAVDVSLLVVDEVDSSGVGECGSHDGIADSGCMLVKEKYSGEKESSEVGRIRIRQAEMMDERRMMRKEEVTI